MRFGRLRVFFFLSLFLSPLLSPHLLLQPLPHRLDKVLGCLLPLLLEGGALVEGRRGGRTFFARLPLLLVAPPFPKRLPPSFSTSPALQDLLDAAGGFWRGAQQASEEGEASLSLAGVDRAEGGGSGGGEGRGRRGEQHRRRRRHPGQH